MSNKARKIILIIIPIIILLLIGYTILKYQTRKYEVTFVSNSIIESVKKVTIGSKVVEPAEPQVEGYNFLGWLNENNEKFDFSTPITKNIKLIASFEADPNYIYKYNVNFDSNGGSTVETQTIEKGKIAIEPTIPTKNGFVFVKWKLDDNEYDFTTPVTKNISLLAEWTVSLSDDEKNLITAKSELTNFDVYKANQALKTSAVNGKCSVTWRNADFSTIIREKDDVEKKVTADIKCGVASIAKSVIATIKKSTYTCTITENKSSYKLVAYDGETALKNYKLFNSKMSSIGDWKVNKDGSYVNLSASNYKTGSYYYLMFKNDTNTKYYVTTK